MSGSTTPSPHLIITCEHGGNRIPQRYRTLFAGCEPLLQSHRGYDPGALALAREMAGAEKAPLVVSTVSRLLVDLNRSIGHPRLHGDPVRQAPAAVRREIMARYYFPYRARAEDLVARAIAGGSRVVHVSSHSFTPVLDGEVRQADIGLLYDPSRPEEKELCARWRSALKERARDLKVRLNYPYTGKSDGFTAYLRRRFPADRYIGIELEINQRRVRQPAAGWRELREIIVEALHRALA